MSIMSMKLRSQPISGRTISRLAALAFACVSLGGCVYYPSGYGYAAGPGYYRPAIVAPPVIVGGWWGGGWGRDRDWGDDD